AAEGRGRRLEPPAGRDLRDAQGRVLRVSQRQAHRLESQGARLLAARGFRRRHHRRAGLPRPRRGLCAAVLRQLAREHPQGTRSHGRVLVLAQGGVGIDRQTPRRSGAAIAEIAGVFDLASFCQKPAADRAIPRRMARVAVWLLVLYRPNAGNLPGDARVARLGTIKLKARKHWLEPCARRNATEANRPAVRLPGARDVRRMSPHPISPKRPNALISLASVGSWKPGPARSSNAFPLSVRAPIAAS